MDGVKTTLKAQVVMNNNNKGPDQTLFFFLEFVCFIILLFIIRSLYSNHHAINGNFTIFDNQYEILNRAQVLKNRLMDCKW